MRGLEAFSDRHGIPPDIRSVLFADAWLREEPRKRKNIPVPDYGFFIREDGLALPQSCAIQYRNSTRIYVAGSSSLTSASITSGAVVSGDVGIVMCTLENGFAGSNPYTSTNPVCTWGGVSMTLVDWQFRTTRLYLGQYIWWLPNPPVGTSTVTVTTSGGVVFLDCIAGVHVYSGVDLNTVGSHSQNNAGTAVTSLPCSATTDTADGLLVSNVCLETGGGNIATPLTNRQAGNNTRFAWKSDDKFYTSAGSQSFTYTTTSTANQWDENYAFFPRGANPITTSLKQAVNRASTF